MIRLVSCGHDDADLCCGRGIGLCYLKTFCQEIFCLQPVSEAKLILEGGSSGELKRAAMQAGMKSLRKSGLHKIREGVTTAEEVLRVTAADDDGNGRSAQKLDPDTDHTLPE